MQLNEMYFAGFAGRDAEEITTPGGVRIVKFSVCQTEKGRDGRGDISTWVEVISFGAWCDLAAKVRKGNNVMVKGKLQVREWQAKEGHTMKTVEVVAMTLAIFLRDERSEAQQSGTSSSASKSSGNGVPQAQTHRQNPSPPRDQW